MTDHQFGGPWTDEKLGLLRKYLEAYRVIFTKNKAARYFVTWYVDAFAGTGARVDANSEGSGNLFQDVYTDADNRLYRDGSVRIALGLSSPFNYYLFVEKARRRVEKLNKMINDDYEGLAARSSVRHGDANQTLLAWCRERDWRKERAVVFLDPYGMQVEWRLVEALASTKAVDLWYLFPIGIGVVRLLKRDGQIEEAWQKRLDLLFGTREWRSQFYQEQTIQGLFGDVETKERDATIEGIRRFVNDRLKQCFAKVAKGRILRNSKGWPLYLLCFASSNERGAPHALRIARSILEEENSGEEG